MIFKLRLGKCRIKVHLTNWTHLLVSRNFDIFRCNRRIMRFWVLFGNSLWKSWCRFLASRKRMHSSNDSIQVIQSFQLFGQINWGPVIVGSGLGRHVLGSWRLLIDTWRIQIFYFGCNVWGSFLDGFT